MPAILSRREVAPLNQAASTDFHRTLLITLYATGAGIAEVTRLKPSDFDKQCMVVHIQGGKGRKGRFWDMAHKRSWTKPFRGIS